jgi:hypothetical protein
LFASVFAFLDFSQLSHKHVKSLFKVIPLAAEKIGLDNILTIITPLTTVTDKLTSFQAAPLGGRNQSSTSQNGDRTAGLAPEILE